MLVDDFGRTFSDHGSTAQQHHHLTVAQSVVEVGEQGIAREFDENPVEPDGEVDEGVERSVRERPFLLGDQLLQSRSDRGAVLVPGSFDPDDLQGLPHVGRVPHLLRAQFPNQGAALGVDGHPAFVLQPSQRGPHRCPADPERGSQLALAQHHARLVAALDDRRANLRVRAFDRADRGFRGRRVGLRGHAPTITTSTSADDRVVALAC